MFPEGTFLPNPESDALIGPVGRNTTKHSEQLSISTVGTIQPGRGDLQAEGPHRSGFGACFGRPAPYGLSRDLMRPAWGGV